MGVGVRGEVGVGRERGECTLPVVGKPPSVKRQPDRVPGLGYASKRGGGGEGFPLLQKVRSPVSRPQVNPGSGRVSGGHLPRSTWVGRRTLGSTTLYGPGVGPPRHAALVKTPEEMPQNLPDTVSPLMKTPLRVQSMNVVLETEPQTKRPWGHCCCEVGGGPLEGKRKTFWSKCGPRVSMPHRFRESLCQCPSRVTRLPLSCRPVSL